MSFVDLENRQGVSSLSTVTVRAGDAQHRFSTFGITNVELLVDGEQANQFTKTTATDHVDYTFDLSGLNLNDGVHRLVAVAYDDYWQTSNARIEVLLDTEIGESSAMQTRTAHTTSTMTTLSNQEASGTKGAPKKQRYVPGVRAKAYVVYRRCRQQGDPKQNELKYYEVYPPSYNLTNDWQFNHHAFLAYTDPDDFERWHWHGFAVAKMKWIFSGKPGVVRAHMTKEGDELGLIDGTESQAELKKDQDELKKCAYYFYGIYDVRKNELTRLADAIAASAASPPPYFLLPNAQSNPYSKNCVTWSFDMMCLFHSWPGLGMVRDYARDQRPWMVGNFARILNDGRHCPWEAHGLPCPHDPCPYKER